MTEQSLYTEIKSFFLSLSLFLFRGADGFHRLFRKWLGQIGVKKLKVFISVSFSPQRSLKFLLQAIWSGYSFQKEITDHSVSTQLLFNPQVDSLKQPFIYLRF